MAKLKNLRDLFENQIQDLYSAEDQLTGALEKMANKATHDDLKNAFKEHLKETREQKDRLKKIAKMYDFSVEGETCHAMEGLIKEARSVMTETDDPDVMDAALIADAQRIEHYEISGYGTARQVAQRLDMTDAADLLSKTLDEEKTADRRLNALAKMDVNADAEA